MCGFLGEFTYQNHSITDGASFESLLALSKHRGPDATEMLRGKNFQLGFNRLAILDLSAKGNQPKASPSGRYQVVFNGEIYNYKDLAKTYGLANLSSSSDTEVLIHLLDSLGVEATFSILNGMFAMAIIDIQDGCLYLTRDFAGIKPLFYGMASTGIVFASQFDQVFKHNWFRKDLKLRIEIVKEYFGFGYMQAPNTVFKSIYQVNPGELILVNKKGEVIKRTLVSFKKTQSKKESKVDLGNVLHTAVSKQLVSDVPIGTFLSGGIDSPLISAYAKKYFDKIEAFTLKVDNAELNESEIAKGYGDHLNIKQHVVSISETELLSEIDAHFKAYSEPFGDYSSIPSFVISKEARKRHTVMLSGDGGDELFFGYPRMLDVVQKRLWFKLPFAVRRTLVGVTNKFAKSKTWAPYFKTMDAFIIRKHLKVPMEVLDAAFPSDSFSQELTKLYTFKNNGRKNLLYQLRWNEFYGHMQRILIKVDRASMAHSLEVRVPFLDKNVIEATWQQPSTLFNKNDLKKELKILLADEIPESLINQKKMGFTVPMYDWMHQYLKADVLQVVCKDSFYGEESMDASALRQHVQDFFDHKHSRFWGVWHIYAWQKWAAIHVKGTKE